MESYRKKLITAFKTMKGLGIPSETIRPVLMRLLNLYNDDWTIIEENNYQILTDAIFDSEEAEIRLMRRPIKTGSSADALKAMVAAAMEVSKNAQRVDNIYVI